MLVTDGALRVRSSYLVLVEMGTFDPQLGAFIPTEFLGSPPQSTSKCVQGFDQLAYIAGVSSNIFNELNNSVSRFQIKSPHGVIDITPEPQAVAVTASGTISTIAKAILTALEALGQTGIRLDSAAIPNAFFGLSPDTFPDSNQTLLTLVDGGEDGETDPLQPLLVQTRGVDTIIVIDAVCSFLDSNKPHMFLFND